MIEITNGFLYIKDVSTVIKSSINRPNKPIYVNKRHNDAFVYILSGSCTYNFSDNYSFSVKENDILYLSKNSVYKMTPAGNYGFIFCDFEFLSEEKRKCDFFTAKVPYTEKRCFEKLLYAFNSNRSDKLCVCTAILYEIYGAILSVRDKKYNRDSVKHKIVLAKDRIDRNPDNPELCVASLAESAEMSEVYFRKKFREIYSVSPKDYIISARIEKAKSLLKLPFLTLSDCATQSGFSSVQYFCRIFTQKLGITPKKYKDSVKNN